MTTETITTEDLDQLFATDPENLSKQDIGEIVTALRAEREGFVAKEAKKSGGNKKAAKPKGPTMLDLGDLL